MSAGGGLPRRQVFADASALAHRAAEVFVMAAGLAMGVRGGFSVAFSGGTTPGLFMSLLSEPPYRDRVRWADVHVFFVDERCVPPDHQMSNFRLAHEALLSKVPAMVHRIEGELGPEEGARRYGNELMGVLGSPPVLDMVFLGMGADGHTASLFPGSAALDERELPAVAVPEGDPPRVSLSMSVINSARSVVFHVTGGSKARMLRSVFDIIAGQGACLPSGEGDRLPAGEGACLPSGEGACLPSGEGDRLPAGEGDRLPAGEGDRVSAGEGDRLPSGEGDRLPSGKGHRVPPAGLVKGEALWLLDSEAASALTI